MAGTFRETAWWAGRVTVATALMAMLGVFASPDMQRAGSRFGTVTSQPAPTL